MSAAHNARKLHMAKWCLIPIYGIPDEGYSRLTLIDWEEADNSNQEHRDLLNRSQLVIPGFA